MDFFRNRKKVLDKVALYGIVEVHTLTTIIQGVVMGGHLISIKEIVKKYNIPYSTVNHYTNISLLSVASRNKNTRFYKEAQVRERLRRISELRGKGYPLHLIRKELRKI